MILVKFFLVLLASKYAFASNKSLALPGCQSSCGGVDIPYPFGIGPNCFRAGFELQCVRTETGDIPYLQNYLLLNINISAARARISNPIAWQCNDTASNEIQSSSIAAMNLLSTPFRLTRFLNKFIVVGCRTLAQLNMTQGGNHTYFQSGCVSFCNSANTLGDLQYKPCSGMGCCQTNIPGYMAFSNVTFDKNYSYFPGYNPCRYAALMEENTFNFTVSYVNGSAPLKGQNVSLLLDWTIGNQSCASPGDQGSYACKSKLSNCVNASKSIGGYICTCKNGYEGNPYIEEGCQDFNECKDDQRAWCPNKRKCHNTEGGYWCSCPLGWKPNATSPSEPCVRSTGIYIGLIIASGIGICLALCILIRVAFVFKKWYDIRQTNNKRRKNSDRHYKMVSLMPNSSNNHINKMMRIFAIEELEKSTSNFDPSLVVGKGAHGEIYKGILSDKRVVAIKKPLINKDSEIKEFLNEVLILSQLNHRNVVKLFGCCLEDEVPLVVYEFISNGTLSDHLHVKEDLSLSWNDRLRIALETARALSYLHSAASISVFHRDIKTSNILLNDGLTAKLSDFGASRIVPNGGDKTAADTIIQGTFGYLDPEYHQTGRLTAKSDVYSFGVILAELLTRMRPISPDRIPNGGSLVPYFCFIMKEGRLHEILDAQILEEENIKELTPVAVLAEMCMRQKGEERPTMKEVEMRLEDFWGSKHRSLYNRNQNRDENREKHQSMPKNQQTEGATTSFSSLECELALVSGFPR